MFCRTCGKEINDKAVICVGCGVPVETPQASSVSDKNFTTALLLCVFLGVIGAHRFYVGKIGSGVAMILVGWLTLFIWQLVDLITIITGNFRTKDGKKLARI